ncbi:MAG: HepT-like ribonuclease domain-containing protein, partial [Candidatus Woesearchaeota archaeon]
KTLYAVIRCFEIIGEASKNIDNEFKEKYHNLPWKEMSGLRDKLIHAYFGVDINLLWNTIKNNLPKLKSDLINIIKEQEK